MSQAIESEINLHDVVGFLLRNMRMLAIGLAIGLLIGVVHAFTQTPEFESEMTLQFDEANKQARSMDMFDLNRGANINKAIPILQSRSIAESVVKKLALNARLVNITDQGFIKSMQRNLRAWINPPELLKNAGWSGKVRYYLAEPIGNPGPVGSISIRSLSVPHALNHKVLKLKIAKGSTSIAVADTASSFAASCKEGEECRLSFPMGTIRFLPTEVRPGFHSTLLMSFRSLNSAASLVRSSLTVKHLNNQTLGDFLSVSCRWPDPSQAAALLLALAEAYAYRDKQDSTRSYDQMISFLDESIGPMEASLEDAERRLRQFLKENHLLNMEENYKQGMESIASLEQQRLEIELKMQSINHLAEMLKKSDPMAYGALVSEVSPDLSTAWEQLEQRSVELDIEGDALGGFTENYPQVKKHLFAVKMLDERKEELKKKALSAIADKRDLLRENVRAIGDAIKKVESGMGLDSNIQNRYLKLMRQKTVAERLYGSLLEKREETRISKAGETVGVRVLDSPLLGHQVSIDLKRSSLVGGMLGFLVLGLIAFVRETLDVAIKDPDTIERTTGLYVHGMIPAHKEAEESEGLVTISRPTSVDAEAYRSLRTSIQLASLENHIASIMITSSGPGEGKSTTMCNLAVTLAQSGRKTLVVDCDMRRPVINRYLEVDSEPGLSEILSGGLDWHESVRSTSVEGLFAMPAGSIPSNPSELIGRAHMADILAEMKQEYDFVLCDVPPILVVSDAALLASHLDGVLILMRSGKAIAREVSRAREQMERVGGKVLGGIFNGYSGEAGSYGSYSYSYGRHSGYYQQNEEDNTEMHPIQANLAKIVVFAKRLIGQDKG